MPSTFRPIPPAIARLAIIAAVAVVVAAVFPWRDLQDHPHWDRVGWLPFISPPVRLRDVIANVALFMPLGAAIAWHSDARPALVRAAAAAATLSLAAETVQLFSHSRFPSATDAAANVSGAVIAAALVRHWRRAVAANAASTLVEDS